MHRFFFIYIFIFPGSAVDTDVAIEGGAMAAAAAPVDLSQSLSAPVNDSVNENYVENADDDNAQQAAILLCQLGKTRSETR